MTNSILSQLDSGKFIALIQFNKYLLNVCYRKTVEAGAVYNVTPS